MFLLDVLLVLDVEGMARCPSLECFLSSSAWLWCFLASSASFRAMQSSCRRRRAGKSRAAWAWLWLRLPSVLLVSGGVGSAVRCGISVSCSSRAARARLLVAFFCRPARFGRRGLCFWRRWMRRYRASCVLLLLPAASRRPARLGRRGLCFWVDGHGRRGHDGCGVGCCCISTSPDRLGSLRPAKQKVSLSRQPKSQLRGGSCIKGNAALPCIMGSVFEPCVSLSSSPAAPFA